MKPFRKSKFNAKRTNGYASKREAEYAEVLRRLKLEGEVLDWLEQVPVKLPGGIRYVCDFLVFWHDGKVTLVEIKGHETPEWKLKYRVLSEARPEIFKRLEVLK